MTKCMVLASLLGLMVKVIRVNMFRMKNKEKEGSIMEMARIMKENGLREGSTEEVSSETKAD